MALAAAVQEAIAGRALRAALLIEFEFQSSTERIWPGNYTLTTPDDKTWRAVGVLVSVDGLRTRVDLAAEALTFKISGVDAAMIAIARQGADEAKGYSCNVYLQFFNESWEILDSPILLKSAIMDQINYRTVGPTQRDITLTAESIFVARNYAPYAYYTDRDQNARFPGDRGLELIGSMIYKTVTWPDY
jgi:hypothetical protein